MNPLHSFAVLFVLLATAPLVRVVECVEFEVIE